MKNIRNNLINARKFVFLSFGLNVGNWDLHFEARFISWSDIHGIYDGDAALEGNLQMAHKLTCKALHPGNNKQNAVLAIAIFRESTIAGCKRYYPEKKMLLHFLL